MSNRFLFIKHGCRACLEYERAIYRINMFLPLNKKIIVRDNFEFEKFGIKVTLLKKDLVKMILIVTHFYILMVIFTKAEH
jgi:hypothetical protein